MRKVILILGKTGCGKTTLSKKIRSKFSRVLTLDPLHEYDGTIIENLSDFFTLADSFKGNNDFNYTCRFESDIDVEYLFKFSCIYEDFLFVIEEAEIYLDPRSINKDFLWLIRYGRHKNISLLCVARRVPEITIDFRAQCSSIISYKQTEPNDLKLLNDYGFDSDKILNLSDHEYVILGENADSI